MSWSHILVHIDKLEPRIVSIVAVHFLLEEPSPLEDKGGLKPVMPYGSYRDWRSRWHRYIHGTIGRQSCRHT